MSNDSGPAPTVPPTASPATLDIAIISDVMCPWCVIGIGALEQALARLDGRVSARVSLHPFELNPDMPRAGENVADHIARKYGRAPGESSGVRDEIRRRAAEIGFAMNSNSNSRIWNSFDCHRLLHWAATDEAATDSAPQSGVARAMALKKALFAAHFTDNRDMGDPAVLSEAAFAAGLDPLAARALLDSDRYAAEVRAEEAAWRGEGIAAVPTFVINGRYVISGGHSADIFERALLRIAEQG